MTPAEITVELHCHTVFSKDGLIGLEALVQTAERVELDAIAITDHDTTEGAVELQRYVKSRNLALQVIVGEERTLADGSHLIGLFLSEPIHSKESSEVLAEIEAQGGLCLIPHPFRPKDGLFRHGLEPLALFDGRAAGFELFNAKCAYAENQRAAELLATPLCPFGGSDAHYESDLGECINILEWAGTLRTSVDHMFARRSRFAILGKSQREKDGERAYAPLYYRVKKYVRLPKILLPGAKQCYRCYRNFKVGIGRKALREIYRHA